jgi:hypothetical protein
VGQDMVPVRFSQRDDAWIFEIVVSPVDECSPERMRSGPRVLPGRLPARADDLPQDVTQPRKEQVDTLAHEIGHTLRLRHFFANVSEQAWPSEVFGTHAAFSITNYGAKSELTDEDRSDLQHLYQLARSGQLTHINGAPIRLVTAFSALTPTPDGIFTFRGQPIS